MLTSRAMSDEPNPYAPPAPPEQIAIADSSSPVTDADEGLVGEYVLSPEDARAVLAARRHKYASVGWAVAVAVAALNIALAAAGLSQNVTGSLMVPGVVALLFFLLRVWLPMSVGRAVERLGERQRHVRVSVGDGGVRIVDGIGTDTRVKWGSYKGWFEGPDRVFLLLPSGASHVLPRRAWANEGDFESVRDVVRRQLAPAATVATTTTRRFGARALILWVVLILLFVAIWNFFSDVPRGR
jgi:hypothetical protein